jgi:RNA polymerase sigma-70 factor (ECF subfamily)
MKTISFRNDVLPLKNELYRLALRITLNSAEAEDVVQDTLIKVWDKRDSWQEINSVEAFSLTICRNLALDRLKKKGNDNLSIEEESTEPASAASNPLEQTLQNDRIDQVRRLIN